MILDKLTLLKVKRNILNKIEKGYYVNGGIISQNIGKKTTIEKDYVAPPSYLWSFVDNSNSKIKR